VLASELDSEKENPFLFGALRFFLGCLGSVSSI